jgi:hypothetical protein
MVDNNQLSGELPNSLGYAPALQILWVPLSKEINSIQTLNTISLKWGITNASYWFLAFDDVSSTTNTFFINLSH